MRRFSLTAALAAVGMLALAGTASADVGDIRFLDVNDDPEGTAEAAQVSGQIRCTTTIDYGLVVKVAQDSSSAIDSINGTDSDDASIEGVGAYGPNADPGNNANSPCSTNLQSYEVVVERNRDSGTYQDTDDSGEDMGLLVIAGTSAENGDRGPGPFIGDLEYTEEFNGDYTRTDP